MSWNVAWRAQISRQSAHSHYQGKAAFTTTSAEDCALQRALRDQDIVVYGGDRAAHALGLTPAPAPKKEYGSKELTLELVASLDEAVQHIHSFGSGHTEAIVTGQS